MIENPSTNSDLELFSREISWDSRPTISKLYSPCAFAVFGFSVACAMNFLQRRPIMSGIQKHIAFSSLGIPVGLYAEKVLDARHARRDAELVFYMQTHPGDFPPEPVVGLMFEMLENKTC